MTDKPLVLTKAMVSVDNWDHYPLTSWLMLSKRVKNKEFRNEGLLLLDNNPIHNSFVYEVEDVIIKSKEGQVILILKIFNNRFGAELNKKLMDDNYIILAQSDIGSRIIESISIGDEKSVWHR